MKSTRRIFALLLCLVMCISLFPAEAFAEEADFSGAAEVTEPAEKTADSNEIFGDEPLTSDETEPAADEQVIPAPVEEGTDASGSEAEAELIVEETVSNEAAMAASGTCGENLTWTLDDEGTLTISGEGAMADYDFDLDNSPFASYRGEIKNVVIESGVTSIGADAFDNCYEITSVSIPLSVTAIGVKAFHFCDSLTSITIPAGVLSIGEEAFSCCSSLMEVNLSDGLVFIGSLVFYMCSMTSFTIPASVTDIAYDAFAYCEDLEAFAVEQGNEKYSSLDGVVFSDNGTVLAMYPTGKSGAYEIPAGVTGIGNGAFYTCAGLTDVTVPDSVLTIGDAAFEYCTQLKNVTLGQNVTTIGDRAFYSCIALTGVTIPDSVTGIGEYAFFACQRLENVTLGTGLLSIGSDAFRSCGSLTVVDLPASVTYIGEKAFIGCNKLQAVKVDENNTAYTSVDGVLFSSERAALMEYPPAKTGTEYTIPAGTAAIDAAAFNSCSMESIEIPAGVNSVGDGAFSWCQNLTAVLFAGDAPDFGSSVFYNDRVLVYVPENNDTWTESNMQQYDGTVTWVTYDPTSPYRASGTCGAATDTDPDGENLTWTLDSEGTLTVSGSGAMADWSGSSVPWVSYKSQIKSVVVENGVTGIGSYAFAFCKRLTNVTVPDGVTVIGPYAFKGCTALTDIAIPEGIKTIASYAFADCSALQSAVIAAGLETIGAYAFNQCRSLQSFTIPAGVTEIGDYAFSGCTGLQSVTIPEGVKEIGSYTFNNCTGLQSVTVPEGVKEIGNYTFADCTSLTSVNIPESAAAIGEGAFEQCSIESITIPASVASIGGSAFSGCSKLTAVTFKGNAPADDRAVFYGCTLTAYYPVDNTSWTDDTKQSYGGTVTWVAYEPEKPSGTPGVCGENLTWTLDSEGTLTISGSGAMTDWTTPGTAPWYADRNNIKSVVIGDGVTSIGTCAFYNCGSLTAVTLPDSVAVLGRYAFDHCGSLTDVVLPTELTTIGEYAFSYCSSLRNITVPETVTVVRAAAFKECEELSYVAFTGDEPSLGKYLLTGDMLVVFYPANNGTWLVDAVQETEYDNVTWVTWDPAAAFLASGTCGENLTWTLDKDGLLTISGSGAMTDWSSGGTVPWYSMMAAIRTVSIEQGVTTIGGYAFCGYNKLRATEITVPEGVTAIGKYAFSRADRLVNVTLPESLTDIGQFAFEYCTSLKEVNIPAGVTCVSNYLFENCRGLEKVTIPYGVTSIGAFAFYYCSSLQNIAIPDSVTEIVSHAFYKCTALQSITIPASVTSIGEQAFMYCNSLTAVTFKGSAPEIDIGAFGKDTLTAYYPAGDSSWDSVITNKYGGTVTWTSFNPAEVIASGYCGAVSDEYPNGENLTWTLDSNGLLTISGTGAMMDWSSAGAVSWGAKLKSKIKSVVIEDGVTTIGNYAFQACTNLLSVTIPETVTAIDKNAFYTCYSLTAVTIPEGVTSIGENAFYSCYGLESIEIPESVTGIGIYAFGFCKNLKSVTIPSGLKIIKVGTFKGCSSLTEITIPENVEEIDSSAFAQCTGLTSVMIPAKVSIIVCNPFDTCTGLQTIEVDPKNTSYCSVDGVLFTKDMTELVECPGGKAGAYAVPDIVETIGYSAFHGCTSLTEVSIPANVTIIQGEAFGGNTSLEAIDVAPDNTKYCSMDGVLFNKDKTTLIVCPGGKTGAYEIPDGVEYMGSFEGCVHLTSVSVPASVEQVGGFYECTGLTEVTLAYGVKSIGHSAFRLCSSLANVAIPDSVTYIDEAAFELCSSLVSITIPESVTYLGNDAFSQCTSLKSVRFEGSAPTIGGYAFSYDTLTAYYPAGNSTWTEDVIQQYGDTVGGTVTWIGVQEYKNITVITGDSETVISSVTVPENTSGVAVDESIDESLAEEIRDNTSVSGVQLNSIQAVINEAAKDENFNTALTAAADTKEVDIAVKVEVTTLSYEDDTVSKAVFRLEPVATVTVTNDGDAPVSTDVPVTNDMIDTTSAITMKLFTWFEPEQIIHTADDGSVIEIFSGDSIAFDESTGICTVTIHHFSSLTVLGEADEQYSFNGDCNGDGVVDLRDLLTLKKALAEGTTVKNPVGANINGDSAVDLKDLLQLKRVLAGVTE